MLLTGQGKGVWEYALVTSAYWGFTVTDGALRMLVLLQFYFLGYSAFQIAFLFLFYEIFGVITNLVGGWIGANMGLRVTLFGGMAIQIFALVMMAFLGAAWPTWLVVAWVMVAQALSGIAKDLTKMSSKSAIKAVVPENAEGALYKWVSLLTGSKNALKGVGFFVGALLFTVTGFTGSVLIMAAGLAVLSSAVYKALPKDLGERQRKAKFRAMFSMDRRINILSAARFFLFGARDVWFVVALPVFFSSVFGWSPIVVGAYLALWTIGYGIVQSLAPRFIAAKTGETPKGYTVFFWALVLTAVPLSISLAVAAGFFPGLSVAVGLAVFGVIFAINSAVHSYMIVHYAESEKVAMTIGFYYMANAGGRLIGTVLSGFVYQYGGIVACLWISTAFVGAAAVISAALAVPERQPTLQLATPQLNPTAA
ncbi:MAG TPA: organoarsenical effux MFS transporter ArsJ [Candidatus Angelobacter sp.]|nr:organoarsenical effux MFS transporter ArsJ [Candidatus Angelobacter sp.]